jgi:prepilin-type N-terminal cleavage/methylation domain-containing protein
VWELSPNDPFQIVQKIFLSPEKIFQSIPCGLIEWCSIYTMKEFLPRNAPWNGGSSLTKRGFTLLELITVVGIMGAVMCLTVPAMNGIKGAGDLTSSTGAIGAILTEARTEAMMKNSYVFVGFYESDGSQADTIRPAPSGTGRIWVGIAVTKDGTPGYSTANPGAWSTVNLMPGGKLQYFDNIHLSTNAAFYTSNATANTTSPVGDPSAAITPFGWPLENSNSVSQFTQGVIEFTPQGTAMLPGSSNSPEYLQIALIPTHGNSVAINSPNGAVIQVDAITGAVHTFRP